MYLVVPPGGCFPETRRVELGPEAVTIGRAEGCEIRVDVPGVDQEHAKISEVALIALGPDIAIGDVPLDQGARRLVMPGDEIQIGSVVVALEGSDPSISPPRPDHEITARMLNAPPRMEAPRVRVVEGSNFGDELVMAEEGREYLIGRGPKCDLVLEDREVSREHVKLMRRGYSIFVQDLSSTRGSWLGRSAVYTGATVEWSRPRMLRVGATVLSLELPEAIRRQGPAPQASSPMTPPPRSRRAVDPPAFADVPPPSSSSKITDPMPDRTTQKHGSFGPDPRAPSQPPPGMAMPPQMVVASTPPPPNIGALPPPSNARTAWKKSGPSIGKASGLLLLALAGLVILGGLFVVFSLLE